MPSCPTESLKVALIGVRTQDLATPQTVPRDLRCRCVQRPVFMRRPRRRARAREAYGGAAWLSL